jgi:putative ABC transport system permease protein
MAIGAGAQALILNEVQSIGSNLVGVLPGASDEKGPPASVFGVVVTTLKYADLQALLKTKNVPNVVSGAGYVTGSAAAKYENNSFSSSFQGVSASLPKVEKINLQSGRFFTQGEETSLARVAVLGAKRAKDLFPNVDPLQKNFTLKETSFTVVGIMEEKGSSSFSNPDETIFVPLFTGQKLLLGIDYLNFIRIKVDKEENLDRAVADIKATLREQHRIENPADDDFSVRNTAQALSILTNITNVLKYFLVSIAAISLIVGGIGIMNIMLIAVNQRIREIGLRKAVGARNSHIISQFLIESVAVTFLGGIIGIIFGVLVSYLAALIIRNLGNAWEFIISWQSIALATSVTIAIGLLFGLYPARKASKVSPMEALRYE